MTKTITTGQQNYEAVLGALRENPEPLIIWAAQNIVALGAKREWDMEDNFITTEGVAELAGSEYGLPGATDQDDDSLRFYGLAAQHLGYRADIDDETEEED